MRQALFKAWYKGGWWLFFLIPFEQLYKLLLAIRNFYHSLFKQLSIHIPIVVVGNITVGGSGKTPAVIALSLVLMERGLRVGIISHGYKGTRIRKGMEVLSQSDFTLCGDESVLLARKTKCPVYVCSKRVRAAQMLLADHSVDVILSDDGLQHYSLPRSVEMAVVDARTGFGNGHCLPAGPLREPLLRLKRTNFTIVNEINLISAKDNMLSLAQLPVTTYSMKMRKSTIAKLNNQKQVRVAVWRKKYGKVHAIAGIAHPDNFFTLLYHLNIEFIPHVFPDHHIFTRAELTFDEELPILMTEKDGVRCEDFKDMDIWVFQLEAKLDKKLVAALLNKLNAS